MAKQRRPFVAFVCMAWFSNLVITGQCFYGLCNKTWAKLSTETVVNLELPVVPATMVGQWFSCWFKFITGPNQRVDVTVTKINAGYYENNSRSCLLGSLVIHDGDGENPARWPLPTSICGSEEDLEARRVTIKPMSLIEFQTDSLQPESGFKAQVRVMNTRNSTQTRMLTYGATEEGPGKQSNTHCDWIIPVDECKRHCKLYSPGWPGLYPPNTKCVYLLTNAKNERIEMEFGGYGMAGKFNLKESNNCIDDRLSIYDGPDTKSNLIGSFCGHDVPRVISKSPAVVMVFESGPGSPLWEYDGFNIRISERWKDAHAGGTRAPNTVCDWSFSSTNLEQGKGDAHTPDSQIQPNTSCYYKFAIGKKERLSLTLVFYKLLEDCNEYVEVFNGDTLLDTICEERLKRRRFTIDFNATASQMTVKYVNKLGQVSNADQVWMYYVYKPKSPNARFTTGNTFSKSTKRPRYSSPSSGESKSANDESTSIRLTYYPFLCLVLVLIGQLV